MPTIHKPDKTDNVTPPELYFNRRAFIKSGVIAASLVATGLSYRWLNGVPAKTQQKATVTGLQNSGAAGSAYPPEIAKAFRVDEKETPFQSITSYNNFYEFSTDKGGVAPAVTNFSTEGWKITVDGMVAKPTTFDLDDIRGVASPEERIYRMRCVEA